MATFYVKDKDGVRAVPPGQNVFTAGPRDYTFNSSYTGLPILKRFTHTLGTSVGTTTLSFGQTLSAAPYIILCWQFDAQSDFFAGGARFAVSGDSFQQDNVAESPIGKTHTIENLFNINGIDFFTRHRFVSFNNRVEVQRTENQGVSVSWVTGTAWVFVLDWF